jgi:hypothetical protein
MARTSTHPVTFAILCPGKSLKDTLPRNIHSFWTRQKGGNRMYGRVIAVTDGLFADAPITTFCFVEGPNHPHQPRYVHYYPRLKELANRGTMKELWAGPNLLERWNRWKLKEIGVSITSEDWDVEKDGPYWKHLLSQFPFKPEAWLDRKGGFLPGCGNSFFSALALSIIHGATRIDVYGHDREGYKNYDPRTGAGVVFDLPPAPIKNIATRSKEWWEKRWVTEKVLFDRVVEECREWGIEINRVTPENVGQLWPPVRQLKRYVSNQSLSPEEESWLSTARSEFDAIPEWTPGPASTIRKGSSPSASKSSSTRRSPSGRGRTASKSSGSRATGTKKGRTGKKKSTRRSGSESSTSGRSKT